MGCDGVEKYRRLSIGVWKIHVAATATAAAAVRCCIFAKDIVFQTNRQIFNIFFLFSEENSIIESDRRRAKNRKN